MINHETTHHRMVHAMHPTALVKEKGKERHD